MYPQDPGGCPNPSLSVNEQRRKVFEQLFEMGNASLLVACLVSLFIGGVIALMDLLFQNLLVRWIPALFGG